VTKTQFTPSAPIRKDTLRRSDVVLSWGEFDEASDAACRNYGVTGRRHRPGLLLLSLAALSAAPGAVGQAIAEGFDHNTAVGIPLFDERGERIFRSMSSKFAWGAYSASGKTILVAMHNKAPVLRFESGAFTTGSYVYTRFDATTVQASGGMANKPSRTIDLSRKEARIAIGVMRSEAAVQVALLLRDDQTWWRSDACSLPAHTAEYNEEKRAEFDLHGLHWRRLLQTAEMDEVDDGAAAAVTDGKPGTPQWTRIEGLGLMAQSAAAHVVDLAGVALKDGTSNRVALSQPLRHSDIAFLHKPTPLEKFDEYGGAKVVYWDQGWVRDQVALTRNYGVRDLPAVSAGVVENRLAQPDPALKAAIARDLWGREVLVGNESFPTGMQARMCLRQPAFLQYTKDYVRLRVHECGASEALMDEPDGFNGARNSFQYGAACFCDRCNDGFRDWLGGHFSTAELARLGVATLSGFSYRDLLRARVADVAAYRAAFERGELPLMQQFIRFQQEPQRDFFRQIRDYARTLNPGFKFSANLFNLKSELLFLAEEADGDFFGAESELYFHDFKQFGKSLQRLRLADALGIRVVTSGVFWEFRHARARNLVEIFKVVIPAVYASGHHLAVPDLYRWTEPNFVGSIPDLAPFYRFVRQNAELFDDYAPVTQVGVVMDNTAANAYTGDATFRADYERIGQDLVENGILFGIAMGADGLHYRREFNRRELEARFQMVVLPRNTRLQGVQAEAIAQLKAAGRVHEWDAGGMAALLPKVNSWVRCDKPKVLVLPRRNPALVGAPVVVHLVNLDYVPDTVKTKENVAVMIGREIVPHPVRTIVVRTPFGVATPLPFVQDEIGLRVVIPELNYWSVLQLHAAPLP
jgi:hypothetical protein